MTRRPPATAWLVVLALASGCRHAPPNPERPTTVPAGGIDRLLLRSPKPLLSFRLFFRAGSVDDPAGKEGLTALTAALMAEGGTLALPAAAFQRALFPLAAELTVDSGTESVVFIGRVHQNLVDRYLPLLTDAVARPRFDPQDFERLRGDAIDALAVHLRHNDDEALGKAALQALLFDGHPYGPPTTGTVAGLKALTLDDVKAQWGRVFTRDRLTLGLIGQQATPALADRLLEGLAPLVAVGAPPVALPPPSDDGIKALFVEQADDSVALSLGYFHLLSRRDPDFAAAFVANSALGEHRQFGGILFRRLRELRGLNYGDYSYLEHFVEGEGTYPAPNQDRHLQEFSVWLRPVQPANAGFALRAALFEIGRAVQEGFSDAEVDRAKAFLGSYLLAWQASDSRRLGYALDDRFYGTTDFLGSLGRALPTLTAAQVNAALRSRVDPQKLRFAIVGQHAAALRAALIAGQPTPLVYDSPKPAAILAEDSQIAALPLGLSNGNTLLVASERLFETAAPLAALGQKPDPAAGGDGGTDLPSGSRP